jgi:hypothetical protein
MSLPRRPEVQALVHIRPVVEEFAPSFVPGPGYGLLCSVLTSRARGTTKCPESLCLSLALPPSGRRVPPPPRTLLLSLRSYRLMRQSRVALPYFGFWPRSWSLCRLLPAPAATGIIPTLSLRILPKMPEPIPRRFAECVCLVLPQHSSAFPIIRLGQLPASFREHDFPRVGFARIGYAIRPTTGNWRNENFHLARFAALSAATNLSDRSTSLWDWSLEQDRYAGLAERFLLRPTTYADREKGNPYH